MVDQNLVDRELCLEAMRRGLVTKEALIPFAQRRRTDPKRSLAGLLIEAGVFTPELGIEIERLARTRAEAAGTGGAPPVDPLAPSGPNGREGSGRIAAANTPNPGTGSGKQSLGNQSVGTTSGRHKLGSTSSVSLQLPQHTLMDLSDDAPAAPAAPARAATPALKPGDSRAPGTDPAAFRASSTYVDGAAGKPQRTMLEDDFNPSEPAAPVRTMIADDGFGGGAGEGGSAPVRTMIADDGFAAAGEAAPPVHTMLADDGFAAAAEPPKPVHTMLADDGFAAPPAEVPAAPETTPEASTRGSASSTSGGSSAGSTAGIGTSSSKVPTVDTGTKRAVAPGASRGTTRVEKKPDAGRIAVGGTFGDYEILGKLGEGAMGQVFRAKRKADGLVVALKVMRGGLVSNPKVRERFLREAKAAKMMDHVNVVRFIDAGMNGNDQFLAMEFVEGRSLQSVLSERKGQPLDFDRAAELFRQICDGLAHAHEAGVIHRDLKPENVLVTKDGEVCKITDFGLARREEESMLLTRPGQVMGSPYYMAPEQGQGLPVDHRADIYSLGAILFCFFTGRVPFPFPSATEVIHAHCNAERPDPREVNPEVPAGMAAFILKMLAREPESRPQSARAVLNEFDEVYEREINKSVVPSPSKIPLDESSEADAPVRSSQEVVDAIPPGTRLGALTIQNVIGAGGMGAVYRAVHDTGRSSALKVLPRHLATDQKRMEAFLREGHLGARINHPNVVETREYGFDAPMGMAYLEVELVEGTSLESLLKAGIQSEALVIAIARGVAQALDGVHSAGVIHRDLKPANILLSGDFEKKPDAGVKLIDFGLAIEKKDVEPSGKSAFAGTPIYMAPEQAATEGMVDERSDLYSLGATLYHAACGSPPFEGKTLAAISYQHQKAQPKPPRQANPALSEAFEILLGILLAKTQEERFQSAKELLAELSRTTTDGKLQKPQVHAKYRTNRLGKGMDLLKTEKEAEPEAPPPRGMIIGAAAIVVLCALAILWQVGKAVLAHPNTPDPSPSPSSQPIPGGNTPAPSPSPTPTPSPSPVDSMTDRERHEWREKTIKEVQKFLDGNKFLDTRNLVEKAVLQDGTLENRFVRVRDQLAAAEKCFNDDLLEARKLAIMRHWKDSQDKLDDAEIWISHDDDRDRLDKLKEEIADMKRKR